jgi:hypothetical protein
MTGVSYSPFIGCPKGFFVTVFLQKILISIIAAIMQEPPQKALISSCLFPECPRNGKNNEVQNP